MYSRRYVPTTGFTGFKRSAFGYAGFANGKACGFMNFKPSAFGFTLAELLISLAILGVIATFAIPKVLQAQQNERWKAGAKEAAAMISQSYQLYRLSLGGGSPPTSTGWDDLTPYMNYVRLDSTSDVDNVDHTANSVSCASHPHCLTLHSGAKLYLIESAFNATDDLATIRVYYDPDGKVTDNVPHGSGNSVCFFLSYNGRLSTWGTAPAGSHNSGSTFTPAAPSPKTDPAWFSWD